MQSLEQPWAPKQDTIQEPLLQLRITSRFEDCVRQLSLLFVEALNEGSARSWSLLFEYFDSITPDVLPAITLHPRIQHYTHRAVQYSLKHPDAFEHVDICGTFSTLFPSLIARFKDEEVTQPHNTIPLKCGSSLATPPSKRCQPSVTVGSDLHQLFNSDTSNLPLTFRAPLLKVSDLGNAARDVFDETSTATSWGHTMAPPPKHATSSPSPPHPPAVRKRPTLEPVFQPLSDGETLPYTNAAKRSFDGNLLTHPAVDSLLTPRDHLLTVHDVIEAFAMGKVPLGSESVYFNYSNMEPWNPYYLQIVPKARAEPEHFIASKFGLLHVYPDGENDLQSFADWSREATMFCLLRQIPFFRHYLLKKALWHWLRNAKRHRFKRLCIKMENSCVKFYPIFRDGLLRVQHLCEELSTVSFCTLTPLGDYTPANYSTELTLSKSKAQLLLSRYFKYCSRVITEAVSSVQSLLSDLEKKRNHQPLVCDLPLSLQRENNTRMEKEFQMVRHRASQISNYVALADHIVMSCLVHLARQNAGKWLHLTLEPPSNLSEYKGEEAEEAIGSNNKGGGDSDEANKALLCIQISINRDSGTLTTQPSPEDLVTIFTEPLSVLPDFLSSAVRPLFLGAPPPSSSLPPLGIATTKREGPMEAISPHSHLESQRARFRLAGVKAAQGGKMEACSVQLLFTVLTADSIREKLHNDDVLMSHAKRLKARMDLMKEELTAICTQYHWLCEVDVYILTLEGVASTKTLLTAQEFESCLSRLHSWRRALGGLPSRLVLTHRLLSVELSSVTRPLLSRLSAALVWVQGGALANTRDLWRTVLEQAKQLHQSMATPRDDLEGLAQYAKLRREAVVFQQQEAAKVTYILSVHQTLSRYGVEVPAQDRSGAQELRVVWESFEGRLKEASNFVAIQTPLKASALQEGISLCEGEMKALILRVSQRPFTDPSAVPSDVIGQIKKIQEELLNIRARMLGLSKWKEAITGKPQDHTEMASLMDSFFVRHELWKCRRAYDTVEREWMKTPFKKLEISGLAKYLKESLNTCCKLQVTLPSKDPVLGAWKARLLEFQDRISLLEQLSSKSLKSSHWQTIFAALGQDYTPTHPYTLTDFTSYSIFEHSDIIAEICYDALQEEKIKRQVAETEERWDQMTIALTHVPQDLYPFAFASSDRQKGGASRRAGDKTTTFALDLPSLQVNTPNKQGLLSVSNDAHVQLMLEDSITCLKLLLGSPHSVGMRPRMEAMLSTLRQLGELFMSLVDGLRKWLDLLALFSGLEESLRPSYGLETLQMASESLQEVMRSIRDDPRVLSLLSKKRGQTGVRDLQGESLRASLNAAHGLLNSVLGGVHYKLSELCTEFPRLFYLSPREALRVLSHTGNPASLVPLISRVFPAINTISFTEVVPSGSHGHEADEGFQVITIESSHEQCLKLVQPLSLGKRPAPQWLRAFEAAVGYSIACQLTECQAAMPRGLLDQAIEPEATSVLQWLSAHLVQSVAMVTHATWDQAIQDAMQNRSQITELSTKMTAVFSFASEQLRMCYRQKDHGLVLALQTIISILNHKMALVQSVLKEGKRLPISLRYSLSTESRIAVRQSSSRHNMSSLKGSHVPLGEQPLLPRPLEHSSHSLVASFKSLHSSRHSLSNNNLQKGGTLSPIGDPSPSGPSPAKCLVHCGDTVLPYGYELCVPGEEPVLSLVAESCLCSLAVMIGKHELGVLTGDHPERKAETMLELATILGRHCYQFQCVANTTQDALTRVLTGAVLSGSILLLRSCDSLRLPVLVPFGKLLHSLYQAVAMALASRQPMDSNTGGPISAAVSSVQISQSRKGASCLDWYKISSEKRMGDRELNCEVMGTRLRMNPSFGCVMVLDREGADIPADIKDLWRSVELVTPSKQYIAESFLLSFGYLEAVPLSRKLATLLEHIKSQLSPLSGSLNALRGILSLARTSLQSSVVSRTSDEAAEERSAIYLAVMEFFRNRLNTSDMDILKRLLKSTLPEIQVPETNRESHDLCRESHEELREAIKMQLGERHLQQLAELIEKMVQLHQSLQHHRCAVLCGPSLSGRTTAYKLLASAYRHLTSDKGRSHRDFPLVNITVLNVAAYTSEQLFGSLQKGQWEDGIVNRMFNQLHEDDQLKSKLRHPDSGSMTTFPGNIKHWLVLDGPLDVYGHILAVLLSEQGVYHLPNGNSLTLPACCQLLLKTDSMDSLCPSLLHHCAIIYFKDGGVVSYEALINTWLERAPTHHNLTSMSVEILASMIKASLPEAMEFILAASKLPTSGSTSHKMVLTRALLDLLSALLKRGSPSVESCPMSTSDGSKAASRAGSRPVSVHTSLSSLHAGASMGESISGVGSSTTLVQQAPASDGVSEVVSDPVFHLELSSELQMASVFAMAYIWSMAGHVPFSRIPAFNDFARSQLSQLLYTIPLPEDGSLFDYCLDMNTYQFTPWTEKNVAKKPTSGHYVALPELERYAYLTDLYLSYGLNVVIIGDPGMGKSALVEHLIQERIPLTKVTTGLSLSSLELQRIITDRISQLQKRTGSQKPKHSVEHKSVFFIDDLHLVSSRSQRGLPSIAETLIYMTSSSVIMDPVRNYKHSLHNVQYIATCASSEVPHLNARMMAAFNRVPLLPPSEAMLFKVFLHSIKRWIESFPVENIAEPLAEAVAAASVVAFCSIACRYSPTLSQPHLSFTLHDLMHVCQGLLLLSPHDKTQALPQFGLHGRRAGHTARDKKVLAGGKSTRKGKGDHPGTKDGGLAKLRVKPSQLPKVPAEVDHQRTVQTVRALVRLWCHESTRVYADRMVDDRDRGWLQTLLESCVRHCFCANGPQDPGVHLQGAETAVQMEKAGRRGRGGRGRANVPQQSSGPTIEDLSKIGIKVEMVEKLIPPYPEAPTMRQLIAMDQVAMKGEDLTGLMFAKFPNTAPKLEQDNAALTALDTARGSPQRCIEAMESLESQSGVPYVELGDGQVMAVLRSHLVSDRGEKLVLFKAALEHVTRLCRVMASQGFHSLLLGPRGTGRRSLVQLAARVMNAKLFTCSQSVTGSELKSCLKDVCILAGLEHEKTILLVSNTGEWNQALWEHVCQIMKEGLSPGLFSSSELLVMGSKQANRLKKTPDSSYQQFASSVRKHLHIFVVWDIQDGSPFNRQAKMATEDSLYQEECERAVFASLCKSCTHIDCYHPWSKLCYGDIAVRVWQESTSPRWEEWSSSPSQLEALGLLAAHVHITTLECLHESVPSLTLELISPGTFLECLTMTKKIAVKLIMEQKQKAEKLQAALNKLRDVDDTINTLQAELDALKPQKAAVELELQQRMGLITAAKERYMAASKRCKGSEETIEIETKNVELFQKTVKEKFEEVSPLYQSSLEGLSSVTTGDILELMSYRIPPATLEPVFHALCMLFERPETWEDCKQLFLTQNFYENLKFFDKDNVSNMKIQRLERVIGKTSGFEGLEEGSKGIVPLCNWLVALVNYHKTKMVVEPLRQKLKRADDIRLEALETFVSMRKDMEETKTSMEETIRFHKESVQKAASIDSKIMNVSSRLSRANDILSAFAKERELWSERLQRIQDLLESAPGHALLSAANVCYLQCLSADHHDNLMKNWILYCHGGIPFGSLSLPVEDKHQANSHQQVVRVNREFSVCEVFSSQEERLYWRKERIFFDSTMQETVLAARACLHLASSRWPLVFDPHKKFCQLLKAVEEGRPDTAMGGNKHDQVEMRSETSQYFVVAKISDQSLPSKLAHWSSQGQVVVLVLDAVSSGISQDDVVVLLHKGTAMVGTGSGTAMVGTGSGTAMVRTGSGTAMVGTGSGTAMVDTGSGTAMVDTGSGTAMVGTDSGTAMVGTGSGTAIHPNFRLYIVIEQHLEDITVPLLLHSVSQQFSSFYIFNLNLAKSGLCNYLQRLIMDREKPGYSSKMKSMETDWTLHHQQLEMQQDAVLAAVSTPSDSLLASSSLVQTLTQCKATEASTMEQITETTKGLLGFQHQAQLYTPLAQHASTLFKAVQQLCGALKYPTFGTVEFEALLFDVVGKERVLEHASAIRGHVLHAMRKLSFTVHALLQRKTYRRHQLLFPLLLGLEVLLSDGRVTQEEIKILAQASEPVEQMVDLCLQYEGARTNMEKVEERSDLEKKPTWISAKAWCSVLVVQQYVPSLKYLTRLLSVNSEEWKEYLKLEPNFLDSPPGLRDLSLVQKLLIWKILKPEMFSPAVCQFVTLLLGAEFTRTHTPSVASLIQELPPLCICLLQDHDVTVACDIITHTMAQDFQLFSVTSDENLEGLEACLPQLATKGSCVIIEHLHHCSGWTDKLKALLKTSGSLQHFNSKFKMWVILPVTKVTDLQMSGVYCCTKVMEIGDGTGTVSEHSSQLIDDLKLVQHGDFTPKLLPWENYEKLVIKLMQLLPVPLRETEYGTHDMERGLHDMEWGLHDMERGLHDMESRHCPKQQDRHPLLHPITRELQEHNIYTARIYGSLVGLTEMLKGKRMFTSMTAHLLTDILLDTIPSLWDYLTNIVPVWKGHNEVMPHTSSKWRLLPLLQLHQCRVLFYNESIHSGCPTPTINALCFSKPYSLLSVLCQCFADKHRIPLEEVSIQAELAAMVPKDHGGHYLVFHGMKLSGAQWNEGDHYLEYAAQEQKEASQTLFIVFEAVPGIPPKGWRCPIYYPPELGYAGVQVPMDTILTVLNDTNCGVYIHCDLPYGNA